MNAIGGAVRAPLKLLGLVPKMPAPPTPLPAATRDDAEQQLAADDEMRRRRGGAADIVTGAGGAELGAATGRAKLGG